eukprot:TRINITY_DN3088_c0_g1_i1.p1 TRINITY_DN3088_c0_g1~~TRINITY_DN3088_c0_g1_i1.p1  ORF type:complete len:393 (+),score=108.80 TRINITY_DN3088_c0_g1_i1:779-1957(+)
MAAYFKSSGLEPDLLKRIFFLVDADTDERLNRSEFIMAAHMVQCCKSGVPLPSALPPSLVQMVKKRGAILSADEEMEFERSRNARVRSNAFYDGGPPLPTTIPAQSSSALIEPCISKKIRVNREGKLRSESGRFRIGYADTIGRRPNMEDEIVIQGHFRGKEDEDFFGIFDGHGGHDASKFVSENLATILAEKMTRQGNPVQCLKESFADVNESLRKTSIKGGTTAMVALFIGETGYIANAGDCRAVLCQDGKPVRCSTDHKPDLASEEKRIKDLGGFITSHTDPSSGKVISRVCGQLSVARALGDFPLSPYVTSNPEIHGPLKVTPQTKNRFLIMACDGLWDVIQDHEAISMVMEVDDPEKGALKLRDTAFQMGSQDNISVLVVQFPVLDS